MLTSVLFVHFVVCYIIYNIIGICIKWWHIMLYRLAVCSSTIDIIKLIFRIATAVVTSIDSWSALTFTLSWDTEAPSDTSFTVWYSTDGHDSDPSSPPQGALVVSGLNSTSVTITLPDSDNSCKPYYVWIAGITPNGQQGPYSKRRQVEVCQASGSESMEWCKCTSIVYEI